MLSMSSVELGEYLSMPLINPETVSGALRRLPTYVTRLVVKKPDSFC